MLLLFLDEFGDFADSRSAPEVESSRPICGYAGLLMPAENYRAFCDDFVRLRLLAASAAAYARYTSSGNNTGSMSFLEFATYISDAVRIRNTIQNEIKGKDVFSTSYIDKKSGTRSRKRHNVVRYAHSFLSLIRQHGGEVLYTGIAKEEYFRRRGSTPLRRQLPVELVRNALIAAHGAAAQQHSQIKIIFDHHPKDNETKERIDARQRKVAIHAIAKLQTRQEYAQEVIIEKGLHTYIKEPAFHIKSHWSLGVQAADWLCALITKSKSFEVEPKSFPRFEIFNRKLGQRIDEMAHNQSNIKWHQNPEPPQPLLL